MAATVATYAEQLPMANDVHFSSELPPSGKPKEEFRNYQNSQRHKLVSNHYRNMRCNQTLAFVEKMEAKYNSFQHAEMTVWEAFEKLGSYVDSSDPDTDNPNLEHMLQTAEGIRAAGHPDWLQLVGLLHDLGKMMFLWGTAEDGQQATADGPQWALGGDTWVVGCAIPDTIVFSEYNELNPDMHDERYNTPMGIYSPHCGLKNLKFAWGHDEYMYRMLVHNKASIPEEGLACIRYHSCYVLHRSGEYKDLLSEEDEYLLKWVREFNKFDLYTKSDARPDVDELRPYYQSLIDKYMPGKLHW